MKKYNVAVLGATGLVGKAILSVLEQRQFPIENLYLLASERSAGELVEWNKKSLEVLDAAKFDFSKADIGLFSAGGSVSAKYAPKAAEAGCIVIDNTSHFRYDNDVPLVVPEVNPEALSGYTQRRIIANPNCSTIQMVVALKPLHDLVGISRINIATYQAVSGAGQKAVEELMTQTTSMLGGRPPESEVFSAPIAFNVLPHIDSFQENGYTREEMKMIWETRKILGDETIRVNPTAVRVPVFYGHAEALHIETKEKISLDAARDCLRNAPGVVLMDEQKPGGYPTPLDQCASEDAVYVGRLREDLSHPLGLNLWVVADNVRKGAALNAVQIAELLVNGEGSNSHKLH